MYCGMYTRDALGVRFEFSLRLNPADRVRDPPKKVNMRIQSTTERSREAPPRRAKLINSAVRLAAAPYGHAET